LRRGDAVRRPADAALLRLGDAVRQLADAALLRLGDAVRQLAGVAPLRLGDGPRPNSRPPEQTRWRPPAPISRRHRRRTSRLDKSKEPPCAWFGPSVDVSACGTRGPLSQFERRSEADQVLDRCLSVRRDDLAGNEIVSVLELAFGSGLDNGLGARGANLRERI